MRGAVIALAAVGMMHTGLARAENIEVAQLFGSWRLVSFQLRVVGEDAPPVEPFGPHPIGRIVYTPDQHVVAFLSGSDRKPPSNQAEAAALLSSMLAFTGKFRIEGDKIIMTVDGAWNEIYKQAEQVRYLSLNGDKLRTRTAEQASGVFPGKRAVSTLEWERER